MERLLYCLVFVGIVVVTAVDVFVVAFVVTVGVGVVVSAFAVVVIVVVAVGVAVTVVDVTVAAVAVTAVVGGDVVIAFGAAVATASVVVVVVVIVVGFVCLPSWAVVVFGVVIEITGWFVGVGVGVELAELLVVMIVSQVFDFLQKEENYLVKAHDLITPHLINNYTCSRVLCTIPRLLSLCVLSHVSKAYLDVGKECLEAPLPIFWSSQRHDAGRGE